MPFIGRDWRSPGEAWVKTETLGWQRMKIIESQLYPACHQNPACSWPPRSEFGQHMENHCRRHNEQNRANPNELSRSSLSSGSGAGSSSAESSRGSSMSPSPTSSPEKSSMHHIYPITISSPYGQYSCCSHHIESAGSPIPTNSKIQSCECPKSDDNYLRQQTDAQTMSRSLSRDSLRRDDGSPQPDVAAGQTMLYDINRSHNDRDFNRNHNPTQGTNEDLINATNASQNGLDCKQQYQEQNLVDCASNSINNSSKNNPILMKNGLKLDDEFRPESPDDLNGSSENKSGSDQNKFKTNQSCCCCCNNEQVPNMCHQKEIHTRTAPHCRISVRTREVAMYNTISEAFYRLDFCNAIHDIRRFNYICKLLHLLITQNLTSLSGCATKVLFTMLEQVAWEVSSNKRNIHVLKNLLNELRQMIQKYYCWGRPIGSSLLWQQHFDTIERISQIVDGIELSPPKNSASRQVTFNNLPVEMIREILLRLNDYRDLMNSAQASPLMRTMLDGQYIWKQLCKYHFTEQQLKMATDGYTGLPIRRANERGVKYARTSSADGKTSFRNPILKGTKSSSSSSSTTSTTATNTRQQLEQTSSRRGCRQQETTSDTESAKSNASYVTNAIKIFDKEGSPNVMAKESRLKKNGSKSAANDDGGHNHQLPGTSGQNLSKITEPLDQVKLDHSTQKPVRGSTGPAAAAAGGGGHDVDWERVFHQLRKKFDLKEEYADCLLLCRHCRCLFWKSFGHPCVNNHNAQMDERRFRFDHPSHSSLENGSSKSTQNNCNCDRLNRQANPERKQEDVEEPTRTRQENDSEQVQRRPSVAMLSRNFDNRTLQGRSGLDSENAPPPESGLARFSQNAPSPSSSSSSSSSSSFSSSQPANRFSSQQPLASINLNAQLRERNGRLANLRLNNNRLPERQSARSEELVPKHVAISPQAFLKFFSL